MAVESRGLVNHEKIPDHLCYESYGLIVMKRVQGSRKPGKHRRLPISGPNSCSSPTQAWRRQPDSTIKSAQDVPIRSPKVLNHEMWLEWYNHPSLQPLPPFQPLMWHRNDGCMRSKWESNHEAGLGPQECPPSCANGPREATNCTVL